MNWLNTSTGHHAAYQLDIELTTLTPWASVDAWQLGGENLYRHKDAYYFLPNEDEWYKAAYHKNDGVTANYWDYATGAEVARVQAAKGEKGAAATTGGRVSALAVSAVPGGGDGLAQLHQVLLHVGHRLIEDLHRILGLAHQVVEIGAQQAAEPIEEAHGGTVGRGGGKARP